VPTAERPALSVVLVPRTDGPRLVPTGSATGAVDTPGTGPRAVPTGSAAGAADTPGNLQTWVFPFNRPAAPGQDDNQAIAVNTQDGGVVYDVAFALVWAEGEVNSANSAYALASCADCKTVAVAFQVVIVVGQSNSIAPENLAVAINYNCASCVTLAIAQQLLVTVDRPLTDEARAQVEALWSDIAAFGESLDGLAFAISGPGSPASSSNYLTSSNGTRVWAKTRTRPRQHRPLRTSHHPTSSRHPAHRRRTRRGSSPTRRRPAGLKSTNRPIQPAPSPSLPT
jgi:putative peptide zinc metalloprotease protein